MTMNAPHCNCSNKAGDPCRLHDSVTCSLCGSAYCDDVVFCQSAKDGCKNALCTNCQELSRLPGSHKSVQCNGCDKWGCPEHITHTEFGSFCETCIEVAA